jgi:hypothetical protein
VTIESPVLANPRRATGAVGVGAGKSVKQTQLARTRYAKQTQSGLTGKRRARPPCQGVVQNKPNRPGVLCGTKPIGRGQDDGNLRLNKDLCKKAPMCETNPI